MKTLHLSLYKQAFDVMVTGEKKLEFRKDSDWIRSRLFHKIGYDKQYDQIKFTNGYGSDKPYFICEYNGFDRFATDAKPKTYSNGLVVDDIKKGDFVIYCGKILERGNL